MPDIMIIGDTHGDLDEYFHILKIAVERGIKHIFQMGDCGTFGSQYETIRDWDDINEYSRKHFIQNYWVRGNHDDDRIFDQVCKLMPAPHGFGYLRSNIRVMPRVRYFKMFGLQFLEVGGAVSVDRHARIKDERKTGPQTQWWPNEAISDEDMHNVRTQARDAEVDVLLTHDCSNHSPWKYRIKDDPESTENRRKIDEILLIAKPDFHFHGHMHDKYEWPNSISSRYTHETMTYGLECNKRGMAYKGPTHKRENIIVFNTESRQVTWL